MTETTTHTTPGKRENHNPSSYIPRTYLLLGEQGFHIKRLAHLPLRFPPCFNSYLLLLLYSVPHPAHSCRFEKYCSGKFMGDLEVLLMVAMLAGAAWSFITISYVFFTHLKR
ncbi:hypothetical protein E2C01_002822 [Portunus trituberculatus]|uniref:Uncharacterized protein n=1 Tax=Portunus trituberculatus TaxID=210409 RepID=A0A5B7CMY2_PORTR|nr:hypothetical protein [Portunus trituberculatus]